MASVKTTKGVIGILTGGGDVPGLNPAIRAVTIRALGEGYKVVGIRRGWAGLVNLVRDPQADNSEWVQTLTEEVVNRAGRTGGTFLHSSRTNPMSVKRDAVPEHLKDGYTEEVNDLIPEVLKNLAFLGIDHLIPIGGDDTLSVAVRLYREGVKVIAIPKTMDNDVPGTDYCIGFSTCVTRTIEMVNRLRTSAGSHERFLVVEVFGRYAGFTAMLPTMAGAANRCVIPEHPFDIESLTELLSRDRYRNPSKYAIVLVSEGAKLGGNMVFSDHSLDAFGHAKLGGGRRSGLGRVAGTEPQVQPGPDGECHQPEAGLPGPGRGSRCHRVHRPDGLWEPGPGSHPEGGARPVGGAPQRTLRQRPSGRGDEQQEAGERREVLQH